MKSTLSALTLSITSLITFPALADSYTIGFEKSSGTYGASEETDITAVPFIAKINKGKLTYTLSVPLIKVDGPEGFVNGNVNPAQDSNQRATPRRGLVPNNSPVRTAQASSTSQSGIGDLTIGLTMPVSHMPSDGLFIDGTFKVKLPTASVDKGLGTGKADYIGQLELFKTTSTGTLFGTVGYRKVGKNGLFPLQDSLFTSVGYSSNFKGNSAYGFSLDLRGAVVQGREDAKELTGFYSFKSGPVNRWQLYATKGFGDGSVDFAVGTAYTFGN